MKKLLFLALFIILLVTIPKTTKSEDKFFGKAETSQAYQKEVFDSKTDYSLWRSLGALLLVLGVLLAINSYLRKRQQAGFFKKSDKRLFILERAAISQKHQLVLANVDGADYLIGVAPENISFLRLESEKSVEDSKEDLGLK